MIGREATCQLRLSDLGVSRKHVRIRAGAGRVTIEDLGSRHGTLLNGRPVRGEIPLRHGDLLALGECRMIVALEEDAFDDPTGEVDPAAAGSLRTLTGRERRRAERYRIELPIMYESDHLSVETTSRDLSENGVFVCTSILDQVGTDCRLLIQTSHACLTIAGRVRRVVDSEERGESLGLGIEFARLDHDARAWLAEQIRRAAK